MAGIRIRPFQQADTAAAAQVFFESVHQATGDHYDAAQRHAWAPAVPDTDGLYVRIAPQAAFVAERDGKVIGFMTLRNDGYLDLAYVAPGAVGQGVGQALHEAILAEARAGGLTRLTTEASLVARPFFERQGWRVVAEQRVERNGVSLTNFRMEIDLADGD